MTPKYMDKMMTTERKPADDRIAAVCTNCGAVTMIHPLTHTRMMAGGEIIHLPVLCQKCARCRGQ